MLGKLAGRRPVDPQTNGESRRADPAKLAAEVAALEAENQQLKALVSCGFCLCALFLQAGLHAGTPRRVQRHQHA